MQTPEPHVVSLTTPCNTQLELPVYKAVTSRACVTEQLSSRFFRRASFAGDVEPKTRTGEPSPSKAVPQATATASQSMIEVRPHRAEGRRSSTGCRYVH